ncbi:Nif3-like dinuclear metal center hexameric protein [Croceitalea rosinachiae]|uniref:GTP cyclohydrolase 1 type 2 homolog n=1 Tax=Croceitalea rosinachiae TaxID=3075596 RepID=A0ABU3AE09_9FLAO|nr:Nif3-like dinuclear metal center hexameric protein [Croceitalea sp. F388]MDT0608425.1 Nif3-like dinuclear metal center hexameric protein [Croceitalea sp. F388]
MTVKDIAEILEELAPLSYAEDFDNVGILVGSPDQTVDGILVTLDTLENVVDEAIEKKCNLIISFHPIIFKGLKKLTGSNYVERVVMKAIANHITIYSTHTALDNSYQGVNAKICEVLGIKNGKILIPKKKTIKKLTTYVPIREAENLRKKLFEVGAGAVGNYSNCSFSVDGIGTFEANENANPVVGEIGKTRYEKETQLQITYPSDNENIVLKSLFEYHPYDEVAYEIITLENINQHLGMGMVGELEKGMTEHDFLKYLKTKMNTKIVRHSALLKKSIKTVAVLGGSGAFGIKAAINAKADIYITADLKYHEFYQAENKIVIADIGHFETEQFTKNLLVDFLTKKIPNFAITLSESNTNPIKYF